MGSGTLFEPALLPPTPHGYAKRRANALLLAIFYPMLVWISGSIEVRVSVSFTLILPI